MANELEELSEIENAGAAKNELTLSNVYNIKTGGFGTANSVKTYLCTVKVNDLEEDISFYETLTKDKSWPVSQIIQREVDRIRVSNISKDYILGQGRAIKYFPPIIVAILPKGEGGKIDLKLNFNSEASEKIKQLIYERSVYRTNEPIKKYFFQGENQSIIDGLFVLEVSKIFDFKLLCWEKSKYYAIVIDGQHRLASLFKSKKDDTTIGNFTQDVVFMDFSTLIQENQEKYSPIEVVRRVFIDINTNAKKVGVVRQVLMDDKDLAALFVQSMVDSVKRDGSEKTEDSYITSQVVDWYGESLKHTLPHITGILSLYQIFDDYLIQGNLSSIKDLRSENKIINWVTKMNDFFLVDSKIDSPNSRFSAVPKLSTSLEKYLNKIADSESYSGDTEDDNKETEIFSFDYTVLDIAQETFEEKFLRPLIRIFNGLSPYKQTLEIVKAQGGLNSESVLHKALISSRNRIAGEQILKDKIGELRRTLETELYPKYYHLFTVLGQKVIFSLLFQRILAQYDSSTKEAEIIIITDGFIAEMNRMLEIVTIGEIKLFDKKENVYIDTTDLDDEIVDLGTIVISFWEGIIYEDGKIIYNTHGIRSLFSLIQYILSRIDDIINERPKQRGFVVSYLPARIRRILRKNNTAFTDPQIEHYAENVLTTKELFIEKYLQDVVGKWKAQRVNA